MRSVPRMGRGAPLQGRSPKWIEDVAPLLLPFRQWNYRAPNQASLASHGHHDVFKCSIVRLSNLFTSPRPYHVRSALSHFDFAIEKNSGV